MQEGTHARVQLAIARAASAAEPIVDAVLARQDILKGVDNLDYLQAPQPPYRMRRPSVEQGSTETSWSNVRPVARLVAMEGEPKSQEEKDLEYAQWAKPELYEKPESQPQPEPELPEKMEPVLREPDVEKAIESLKATEEKPAQETYQQNVVQKQAETYSGEGKKLGSIEEEYESAEAALRRAEAAGQVKDVEALKKRLAEYDAALQKKEKQPEPVPAPKVSPEKPLGSLPEEAASARRAYELAKASGDPIEIERRARALKQYEEALGAPSVEKTKVAPNKTLPPTGPVQEEFQRAQKEALRQVEEQASERQVQEDRARREDINFKSSVTRAHTEALKTEQKARDTRIAAELKREQEQRSQKVEDGNAEKRAAVQQRLDAARSADDPEMMQYLEGVLEKLAREPSSGEIKLNPSKSIRVGTPEHAAFKATQEKVRAMIAEDEKRKQEEPQPQPQQKPEQQKTEQQSFVGRTLRAFWENSKLKFTLETLWDRGMVALQDKAADWYRGAHDKRAVVYEEAKRKLEELEKIQPNSSASRRLRKQVTQQYNDLKYYAKKYQQWELVAGNRCKEIAGRIDLRLRPYEERVEDLKELHKDATHMLKDWEKKREKLVDQLKAVEVEGARLSNLFGLNIDPESRRRIADLKRQIAAIDAQIKDRHTYLDRTESSIARADRKADGWRLRKDEIMHFGRRPTS